ncbi:three-Cys-motif partner protein TcmP [Brucella intermedia]|uniref:three-Cys-motif partner protein TcmP n=1 Tax=Brucella intermedia TaxID=94625 RepID=UPI002361604E|nr:three-Cys-motif partner protein TcmP [Brucella intermedia]
MPPLKAHSGAKLRLIEHYLNSYFDAVVKNPTIERLRITLVDGFCGGGAFDLDGARVDGTPFLLQAVENAEKRLNEYKDKKLTIDAQFHFVDVEKSAIDHLKEELFQRGYLSRIGKDIFLHNEMFENVVESIQESIAARTRGGAGRSLFLLDQKGYTGVPLQAIRSIFKQFEKAECILTFAIDWLIGYISERPEWAAGVTKLQLSPGQIKEILDLKNAKATRYAIQHILLDHIQQNTNAQFATPFFIRSQEAKKNLWLVHLSQHAKARNVMVDSHWAVKNHSIHQGYGGLEINGFDPRYDPTNTPDFMFAEHERQIMHNRLQTDIARRLRDTYGHDPVHYGTFINAIANETPARLSDIDQVISALAAEREIQIRNHNGNEKRVLKPALSDHIMISRQDRFSFHMG